MKKYNKLVLAAIPLTALMMGACNSSEPVSETTYQIRMNNLIIPHSPAEEVTVQTNVQYSSKMDYVNNSLTLTANDVEINGTKYTFTTPAMPMQYLNSGGFWTAYFKNGQANAGNFVSVLDITGYLSNIVYFVRPTSEQIYAEATSPQVIMSYNIQNSTVKTFVTNSYFVGDTETTYPSSEGMQKFTNNEMIYRVRFHSDMKYADIVLYAAKFAPTMPRVLEAIYLEKLPVTFDRHGYTISATDVIPLVLEGTSTTPYPDFIFNSIEVKTADDDLTKINCNYTVARVFNGSFTGYNLQTVSNE